MTATVPRRVLRESQLTMSLNGGRPVELHQVYHELSGPVPVVIRVTPKLGGALRGVDVFAPVNIQIFDGDDLLLAHDFLFVEVMPGGVGRRGYIEFRLIEEQG